MERIGESDKPYSGKPEWELTDPDELGRVFLHWRGASPNIQGVHLGQFDEVAEKLTAYLAKDYGER